MSVEKALERLEALLQDIQGRVEGLEEKIRPEPMLFTYPQAAKRLGVGLTKLKEMVKRGILLAKREPGQAPMIPLSELVRYATPEAERPRLAAKQRNETWRPIPVGKKR